MCFISSKSFHCIHVCDFSRVLLEWYYVETWWLMTDFVVDVVQCLSCKVNAAQVFTIPSIYEVIH